MRNRYFKKKSQLALYCLLLWSVISKVNQKRSKTSSWKECKCITMEATGDNSIIILYIYTGAKKKKKKTTVQLTAWLNCACKRTE